MQNQLTEAQPIKQAAMPITAVCLSILPMILFFVPVGAGMGRFESFYLLGLLLSVIAGVILGVVSLCRGRKHTGFTGWLLAVIAVTVPSVIIIFILGLFAGIATGLIPIM